MNNVKIVLKILKWVGIVILAIVLLLAILLFILSKKPFVPSNYTKTVETGGELEAKYLAMGEYEVKHTETDAPEDWGKFITYYPAAVETADKTYPVVVVVNGTGVYASKYPVLFKHLASWGFIVIGNEDPSTCSGDSADAALAYLSEQNDDPDSVFYRKVDTAHIGITGHSQGGVGVFNAVTQQPHGNLYTCAVSLSPTEMELADAIGLHYEPDKMTVPTLLLAADANDVISPEGRKSAPADTQGRGGNRVTRNRNTGVSTWYYADEFHLLLKSRKPQHTARRSGSVSENGAVCRQVRRRTSRICCPARKSKIFWKIQTSSVCSTKRRATAKFLPNV